MLGRNLIRKVFYTIRRTSISRQIPAIHSRFLQRTACLVASRYNYPANYVKEENLGKLFKESENSHAHKVLESSLRKYNILDLSLEDDNKVDLTNVPALVLKPPTSKEDVPIDELFRHFCLLAEYCRQNQVTIADERFTKFVQVFCESSHLLSDEQLLEVLRQMVTMPPTRSTKEMNFVELWNNLDVECEHRIERWKPDKLLLYSDAWYRLKLGRVSEFVWESMRKLGRRVLKMPPEQLVQTMFLCNILRKPLVDMFNFEVNLAKCADELSLGELGVMSMGFFKTETPIRNTNLLEHLYKRLMAEIDTVDDITLVSLLKILRYSTKLNQSELIEELLDKICSQVERISLLSCLHAVLLGSELQICHEGLLEMVIKRFLQELPQARLKDLERICFVMGLMNYTSPEGLDQKLSQEILKSLNDRFDEIMKYPKSLPLCLHFLTLKGHYDMDMISSVLDKRFIHHCFGKNLALGREVFHLDSFVKINLKDANYKGNQLTDKQRSSMGKILTSYIPDRKFKLNVTDRILVEIKESIDSFYRGNAFKHILPHYERPDIVICYDKTKKMVVPISADCPMDYSGQILTREVLLGGDDNPDILTVAVVISGWNNVVRGKERLTGLFDMKLKQLRLLGHKYIVIYWHEWREVETIDRQTFLKRQLSSIIK